MKSQFDELIEKNAALIKKCSNFLTNVFDLRTDESKQEVYILCWQWLQKKPSVNLTTYLYNKCRWYKKQRRKPLQYHNFNLFNKDSNILEVNELTDKIMSGLSKREKFIIINNLSKNLSLDEISNMLDMHRSQVFILKNSAIEKMKESLKARYE